MLLVKLASAYSYWIKKIAIILWCLFSFNNHALCANVFPKIEDSQTLKNGWYFRLGDLPKNPGTGGFLWTKENTLESWKAIGSANDNKRIKGIFWLKVNIPNGNWDSPALFIKNTSASFDLYAGGILIYSSSTGVVKNSESGSGWHLVSLPIEAIKSGVLYFRLQEASSPEALGRVLIGSKYSHFLDIVYSSLPSILFGFTTFLLAIFLLVQFIVGGNRSNLKASIFVFVSVSIYIISISPMRQLFINSFLFWNLFELLAALSVFVSAFYAIYKLRIGKTQSKNGIILLSILLFGVFISEIIVNFVGNTNYIIMWTLLVIPFVPMVLLILERLFDNLKEISAITKLYSVSTHSIESIFAIFKAHNTFDAFQSVGEILSKDFKLSSTFNMHVYVRNWQSGVEDSLFSTSPIIINGKAVPHAQFVAVEAEAEVLIEKMANENAVFLHKQQIIIPLAVNDKKWGLLLVDKYKRQALSTSELNILSKIAKALEQTINRIEFSEQVIKVAGLNYDRELVSTLQKILLPKTIEMPNAQVAYNYLAAPQTGGDWFAYYCDEKKQIANIIIGDVTGHGISSAIIAGVTSGVTYACEYMFRNNSTLKECSEENFLGLLIKTLNSVVLERGCGELYMSVLCVSIDLKSGSVLYVNAGHRPFYWVQASDNRITSVMNNPTASLGYSANPNVLVEKLQINIGDVLFLYSAGLLENRGINDRKFGLKKFKSILAYTRDPIELQNLVLSSAKEIWQNATIQDDVTTIVLKWMGDTRMSGAFSPQ